MTHRRCPRYDEMLDSLRAALADTANDVLELGCGTGSLTMLVSQRYGPVRLTVVDGAAEMVEVTRERLREECPDIEEPVTFITSMFEELRLAERAYDLISSNMALHHIFDKQPFYTKLRAALKPGGKLVFADELVVTDSAIQQRYWDWWLNFARPLAA